MKVLNVIALILILVGALNWGLWGLLHFDFVAWLFGGDASWMARFIYVVVGLAGVWGLSFLGKCKALCCGSCKKDH
jgi:uncharacterized membrane protein YuzA (DUF378 family)